MHVIIYSNSQGKMSNEFFQIFNLLAMPISTNKFIKESEDYDAMVSSVF